MAHKANLYKDTVLTVPTVWLVILFGIYLMEEGKKNDPR